MARETITDLKKEFAARDQAAAREIEQRDQEIGRLNSLLDEARRKNYETQQAFRLIKTIVEDAQK